MVRDGAGEVSRPAAHVDDPWRGGTGGAKRIERRIAEGLGLLAGDEGALGGNQFDAHEDLLADHVGEWRSRGTTRCHGARGLSVIGRRRRLCSAHNPVSLDCHVGDAAAPEDGGDFIQQRGHGHDSPVFLILPVSVLGKLGAVTMYFGTMKFSSRLWHSFWSCFSVSVTPSSRTTKALTAWPRISSGTPMTAASFTPGIFMSTFSTSFGATFSPRDLMTSSMRPTKYRYPSSSILQKSPVYNTCSPGSGPGLSFLAVASAFSQYPFMTVAPRMTSWPTTPAPTLLPSSAPIHISVFGIAIPTLAGFRSRSFGGGYGQRLHSVRPYIE